ncbi:MAG TPA: hypothetical protein VNI54_13185 [Thermoanaerobaculia bacterium]|nr:hypothetical protein [Thermoanaerobaculia bacterium]
MRTLILIAALTIAACRYEAPPPDGPRPQLRQRTVWQRTDLSGKAIAQKFVLQPKVLSRCEAGSGLGNDSLVAQPAATFNENDSIYLSMWLAQAPEGLQVSLRVVDEDGDEIGVARRDDLGGARAVTMQVGQPLEPGRYTLEGFWGGNLVCEKPISVVSGVSGTPVGREKT